MTTNMQVFQSMIGQKVRPQELLTPLPIFDWLRSQWDGAIALDAASDRRNHAGATRYYTGATPQSDGLTQFWCDRTWCNPEFGNLKAWLAKADAAPASSRITMLVPVRTHRPWWRTSAFVYSNTIAWLNSSVRFGFYDTFDDAGKAVQDPEGPLTWYSSSFPTPLCLLFKNWAPTDFPAALGELA